MYQRVIIAGNLGSDPEMRFTKNGTAMTRFSVATNRKFGGNDLTNWWRVTVFGKQAETCNQYLQKGRGVLVEGTLSSDESSGGPAVWQRSDGTYAASFDLVADRVQFMSAGEKVSTGGSGNYVPNVPDDHNDEIPF